MGAAFIGKGPRKDVVQGAIAYSQDALASCLINRSGQLPGLTLYLYYTGKRDIALVLQSELAKQLEARRQVPVGGNFFEYEAVLTNSLTGRRHVARFRYPDATDRSRPKSPGRSLHTKTSHDLAGR